mmetsp:Transcript_23693/g.56101  ORF Transcript_23693/g.56101 Transcript_23693/m.56101 type:complete len:81 (-) Transcript_23693:385-627(-)
MILTLLPDFSLRRHRRDISFSKMVSDFGKWNIRRHWQQRNCRVVLDDTGNVCGAVVHQQIKDSDADFDFDEESEVTSSPS